MFRIDRRNLSESPRHWIGLDYFMLIHVPVICNIENVWFIFFYENNHVQNSIYIFNSFYQKWFFYILTWIIKWMYSSIQFDKYQAMLKFLESQTIKIIFFKHQKNQTFIFFSCFLTPKGYNWWSWYEVLISNRFNIHCHISKFHFQCHVIIFRTTIQYYKC